MNRRVLVVDDSEVTRAILARTLRGAGFEVIEARDGAEGAMAALREQPAVVVTDLEMPIMDGFPLLRLLKADPASAHMPVLILTSHSEAASRYWGLRVNTDAQDYGGSGVGNAGGVEADAHPMHGHPYSLCLNLPPLGVLIFTADP